LDCTAEYEIIKQFGAMGLQTFAITVSFEFGPHSPALLLVFISADSLGAKNIAIEKKKRLTSHVKQL
jgi:hypothetical protein